MKFLAIIKLAMMVSPFSGVVFLLDPGGSRLDTQAPPETMYEHGGGDVLNVVFYSLVWIIIHALLQEYIWEVCVCVCVCVYVCVYVCMFMSLCTCTCVCVHLFVRVYVYMCVHILILCLFAVLYIV